MSGSDGKSESLLTGGPDALKLDPSIKARLDAIEQWLNSMQLQRAYLNPDSQLLQNLNLTRSISGTIPGLSGKPLVPLGKGPANLRRGKSLALRGKGPAKPRAASVGDLLHAFTGLTVVKQTMDKLKEQAMAKLLRDWKRLSAGDKTAVISVTTLITAGTLAGILARNETRQQALKLIQGKNLPAPGVKGLSIQVSPCGRDKRFLVNLDLVAFHRWISNK